MQNVTIIKKDADRKTEINRCTINVPSDLKELFSWELKGTETEMEKYVFSRIFSDWEKGRDVSIQSKLDSRKKTLDPVVVAIKKTSPEMREIYRKMSMGENLSDGEKKIVTSLLGKQHSTK